MRRRAILILAAALAFAVTIGSMWLRHSATAELRAVTRADAAGPGPSEDTITRALRDNNVAVSDLAVRSVGGIVILRGSGNTESAQHALAVVKSLGVTRVANLINTTTVDDEVIRRDAERQLAGAASLDGCKLTVHCEKGVLSVTGTVQSELQKDVARSVLRQVRGAREVRVDLSL